MLTTICSADGERFFIDITISDDGTVAQTIGPLQGKELAERWERYTLIRHRTWENILSWDIKHNAVRQEMFNTALRKIVGETDEYTTLRLPDSTRLMESAHEAWMRRHPLEAQTTIEDPDTAIYNFSREEREHIRNGMYKDLNHNCAMCLEIDRVVCGEQEARS